MRGGIAINPEWNKQIRKFLSGFGRLGIVLGFCFGLVISPPSRAKAQTLHGTSVNTSTEVSFTLDNVTVSVQSPGAPAADFVVSEPGSASQVATSTTWYPFRELSITTIPFGFKPATESLPVAQTGGASIYEDALRDYRLQQGGQELEGLTVTLFDQSVSGLRSLVAIPIEGFTPRPVLIDEWVVEAGPRLWIIRTTQEQDPSGDLSSSGSFPADLVISSDSLDNPTSLNQLPNQNPAQELNQNPNEASLATPAWWSGDCDDSTYFLKSPGVHSNRLGAVYLGAPACGPRPTYDSAPDVVVHFFSGSWGVLEWECVEYSMRSLYLTYGIAPYEANGSEVVANYSGSLLVKIVNGTSGKAPKPGDVLSLGSNSSGGHTSVVTASSVNGSGNGSITVIEENASVTGSSTLTVTNWMVIGNAGAVTGWLHLPGSVSGVPDDFDGDKKADPVRYDTGSHTLSWLRSSDGAWATLDMGTDSFNYVPRSDFDGDGLTDPAKFVTSANAVWYHQSTNGAWNGVYTGPGSYDYVPGSDFDGDGNSDPALYLSSAHALWYLSSSTGLWNGIYMGPGTFSLVNGSDFDGDGKTDPALFVPATNALWYMASTTGIWHGLYMGPGSYQMVPASDFDGDGKTDPALFITSTNTLWYIKSTTDTWKGVYMGPGSYQYVSGCDFNGDGKTDPAVFDLNTNTLWYLESLNHTWVGVWLGAGTYTIVN